MAIFDILRAVLTFVYGWIPRSRVRIRISCIYWLVAKPTKSSITFSCFYCRSCLPIVLSKDVIWCRLSWRYAGVVRKWIIGLVF